MIIIGGALILVGLWAVKKLGHNHDLEDAYRHFMGR